MKITILVVGKTIETLVESGIEKYVKRLEKFLSVEFKVIPDLKKQGNISEKEICRQEGILINKQIDTASLVVLLDEKGKEFTSKGFADFIQKKMNASEKHVFFVIGGAYGFSEEVKSKANQSISLSKMTFTHQMVRIFFAEQLYRAFAIINNEPYHHV